MEAQSNKDMIFQLKKPIEQMTEQSEKRSSPMSFAVRRDSNILVPKQALMKAKDRYKNSHNVNFDDGSKLGNTSFFSDRRKNSVSRDRIILS